MPHIKKEIFKGLLCAYLCGMNYLSAENISKTLNHKNLLVNQTFGLNQGDKVALVGPNGAGKSTFLKILAGVENPDTGTVSIRKDIIIGFQDQHCELDSHLSVYENLFHSSHPTVKKLMEYSHLVNQGTLKENEEIYLQKLTDELTRLDAWKFETRIKEIMGKLHIGELENQTAGTLSGGQKKRVSMARVLLMEPDVLILDEPTNHLDMEAIEWLEELIDKKFQTLLMVTHDRYFMDRVCNQIVELNQGALYRYKGNYGYYLEKKSEVNEIRNAEIEKAQNRYRRELEWIRRQPKARGTKAKYRIEAFEETKEVALQKTDTSELSLSVKQVRQGGKVLNLKKVNFKLGQNQILKDFTHHFRPGERVGIIGKNGVGKSSFIGLLTGAYKPDTGDIDWGENTQIGHYSQEFDLLKSDKKIIEAVSEVADVIEMANGSKLTASQFLTQFHFPPPAQQQKIGNLSGGERRRVQLMLCLLKNPNFLILDEPSNDFDINTLHVLEEFLVGFPGTLVVVSHDRFLLDKVAEHLFVFEGDGKVSDFPGNYTQWKEAQESDAQQSREILTKALASKERPTDSKSQNPNTAQKLSFKEKKEFETLELEIPQLETKKLSIENELSTGNISDHQQIGLLGEELLRISQELDEKMMRWLDLSERA